MKNICFDICAIPVYILVLYVYFSRRLTQYRAFRLFYTMGVVSLTCTILDIVMEFVVNPTPLSSASVVAGTLISFFYKLLRNSSLVIYFLLIFAITGTDFRIRSKGIRFLLWAPNFILVILLIQNFFTGNVFSVTAEAGYARGSYLIIFYVIALLYILLGVGYCIYCKRYLDSVTWGSLLSVYVLTVVAVAVEMLIPSLLVEMFSTAVGILIVLMLVVRPEERLDAAVGTQSWASFQKDLHNQLLAGKSGILAVVHLPNAAEVRNYLGDDHHAAFIREILTSINEFLKEREVEAQVYFEHPGNIYLTTEDRTCDVEGIIWEYLSETRTKILPFTHNGITFDPKICVILYPDDLEDEREIINLCHRFPILGASAQTLFRASELVGRMDYEIENHIEEILERALAEKSLEVYYQPIYNVKEGCFRTAEALARLHDSRYGMISPGIFIPASERTGLIHPIGTAVIDTVFRFIAEHDLEDLGLTQIEINLSVSQCLSHDLPLTVEDLQRKYGISPERVNFEITESTVDSVDNVMDSNLKQLSEMGYSFSLDDYGTGYSNLQRLRRLPLSIIKIDKSMIDDMFTTDGSVVIRSTIRMMQGINKKLVMEGVETLETLNALDDLSCDYIQGFYFSRPLPADEFVEFLRTHNKGGSPAPAKAGSRIG